jgi:hypothetical protein
MDNVQWSLSNTIPAWGTACLQNLQEICRRIWQIGSAIPSVENIDPMSGLAQICVWLRMALYTDHGTDPAIRLSAKRLVLRMNIRNIVTLHGYPLITPQPSDRFASL